MLIYISNVTQVQDVGKSMMQLAQGLMKPISYQVQSDLYTMKDGRIMESL